jgi:hypothetical protein
VEREARMEEIKSSYKNLKGRHHLQDVRVLGRIILKWILKKQSVIMLTGFKRLRKRAQWRVVFNMAMKLVIQQKAENFLHTYIHTYTPLILKIVTATIGCGISYKYS